MRKSLSQNQQLDIPPSYLASSGRRTIHNEWYCTSSFSVCSTDAVPNPKPLKISVWLGIRQLWKRAIRVAACEAISIQPLIALHQMPHGVPLGLFEYYGIETSISFRTNVSSQTRPGYWILRNRAHILMIVCAFFGDPCQCGAGKSIVNRCRSKPPNTTLLRYDCMHSPTLHKSLRGQNTNQESTSKSEPRTSRRSICSAGQMRCPGTPQNARVPAKR